MEAAKHTALIGDVGGTNIRLQLIAIDLKADEPTVLKEFKYMVKDYDVFQTAIETFLQGVAIEDYPKVAVIGIAGPISDNRTFMANVGKWGTLDGHLLSANLKIPHFQFLNDFEAASYGVLTIPEDQFVSINGFQADPKKVRGIMGPGTGLGNSVLYPMKTPIGIETIVIPSEGGHTAFPTIDEETNEYFNFFKKEAGLPYISLERSFCGPSFPYMFRFFAQKYPEDEEAKGEVPSPEAILARAIVAEPPRIYDSVFRLWAKIYSEAIANFIAQHLTVGGMYLVNSITKVSIERLKSIDMLANFRACHPEVAKMVEGVPIVVCKVVELGMRGAFFVARRTLIHGQQ
jgi:glucokinase